MRRIPATTRIFQPRQARKRLLSLAGDPSTLSGLQLWADASLGRYDATSGGSAVNSDAGAIARWEDQSGNGNHLTQSTSGNRCAYDATKGMVACQIDSGTGGGITNRFATAGITLDRRDFSLFVVVELATLLKPVNGSDVTNYQMFARGSFDDMNLYIDCASSPPGQMGCYDGSLKNSTMRPIAGSRALIGWVGKADGLHCWCNGSSAAATALSSGSVSIVDILGTSSGGPFQPQGSYKDVLAWNRALSDSEITDTLLAWARQQRGVVTSHTRQLIVVGDSISVGVGSTVNRGWVRRLSLSSGTLLRMMSQSSVTLSTLEASYATSIAPFYDAGLDNILVVFAGTNDIAGGASQGDTYDKLVDLCNAAQTTGFKVVVVTSLPRGGSTYSTYNGSITTNWATFADAVVDLPADSRLDDSSDATYFVDGIHPTNAGHAAIAELIQPKIDGLWS